MEKVTVKNLIDFSRKSDRTKHTFINNMKKETPKSEDGGGGDYWVSCLSALRKVFRTEKTTHIDEKIEMLQEKIPNTEDKRTKDRWQKNIDILYNFGDYNLNSIKPVADLTFIKKLDSHSIIKIDGLPIPAAPDYVFSYTNNGFAEIGAVWFIAKKNGLKKSELGMFCDVMHRYLITHYSDNYKINPMFCIAIDIVDCHDVNYLHLLKGDVTYSLESTIAEIKKYL